MVRQIPAVRDAYGRVTASLRPESNPMVLLPLAGYSRQEVEATPGNPFKSIVEGYAPINDREIIIGKRLYESLSFIGQKFAVGRTYPFILPGSLKPIDLTLTGFSRPATNYPTPRSAGSPVLPGKSLVYPLAVSLPLLPA
jgi:hypothetical protein